MPRKKKTKTTKIKPIKTVTEKPVEEPVVTNDIMESETPVEQRDPYAEARKHLIGESSVSHAWIFDDIPGSVNGLTEEEALENWYKVPGKLRVPGSH